MQRERDRWEAMERLRVQELMSMTDEEALRQMKLLLTAEPPWREDRKTSGLVEQQRLFMNAHRRHPE